MSEDNDKLLIRIGEKFEANATGRPAIFAVFCVACLIIIVGVWIK